MKVEGPKIKQKSGDVDKGLRKKMHIEGDNSKTLEVQPLAFKPIVIIPVQWEVSFVSHLIKSKAVIAKKIAYKEFQIILISINIESYITVNK